MMRFFRECVGAVLLVAATSAAVGAITPEQAEVLRSAQRNINADRAAEAVEPLENLLKEAPTLAEAHRLLGHAYLRLNESDDARSAFVEALSHGRVTGDTLVALARIEREAGRLFESAALLRLAGALGEKNDELELVLAETLLRLGLADEAAGRVERLVARRPGDATNWRLLAQVRADQGRDEAAVLALATAYELAPDATLGRGVAERHVAVGQVEAGAAWYERLIGAASDGQTPPAWSLRWAELLLASGRAAEAADVLKKLRVTDRGQRRSRARLLGQAQWLSGDRAAAAETWREAIGLGLNDPTAVRVVLRRAVREADKPTIQKCLIAWPDSVVDGAALALLVEARLALGDAEGARLAVRRHVETAGLTETAKAQLRRIASAD